ncbi:MAG: hypothetical protein E6J52_01090 [Chloroflexi bacterium]|nr:MAG: hypothetical protein E6J52_01090 [Chloroflexota bacterium]
MPRGPRQLGAVASADLLRHGQRRSLPIVHVADPLAEDGLVLLRERCDVRVTIGLKEPDLAPLLRDVDALIVRSETKVTASLMDAAPRLAVIGRAGVGVDNIDVPAATERGVYVVNAPLGNIVAAAEHTIALALALMRKIPEADRSVRAGDWTRSKLIGRELDPWAYQRAIADEDEANSRAGECFARRGRRREGACGRARRRHDRRRGPRRVRARAARGGFAAAQRAAHCPYAAHRRIDERGAGERRRGCRPPSARHHRRQARALRGERPASTGR